MYLDYPIAWIKYNLPGSVYLKCVTFSCRQGSLGSISVDEGEGDQYNKTNYLDPTVEMVADKKNGLQIGGAPEVFDKEVYLVKEDLHASKYLIGNFSWYQK